MDVDNQPLVQVPLLSQPSSPAPGSYPSCPSDDANIGGCAIVSRFFFVALVASLSIWAGHEASKGFQIAIINDAADTPAGRRFDLLFVSNDEATRIVLASAAMADRILVRSDQKQAAVSRVILRLSPHNATGSVTVDSAGDRGFRINLSLSTMEGTEVLRVVTAAVRRGIARVWMRASYPAAVPSLVRGIEEYIVLGRKGTPLEAERVCCCWDWDWEDEDPVAVAQLLDYCERQREGFIRRLSRAFPLERTVDGALRRSAEGCMCDLSF